MNQVKRLDSLVKPENDKRGLSGNDPDIIALPLYGAGSDGIQNWIARSPDSFDI